MATYKYGERTTSQTLVAMLARQGLIVVFTGVETIALVLWLAFVRDAPVASRAAAVGLGILAVGLLLEHFLTDLAVNDFDPSIPGVKEVTFSASETAVWALWLVIAERVGGLGGLLLAGVVLAALLVPQHTFENNVLRGRGLFSDLLDLDTLGVSVIESVGATLWLLFVFRPDLVEPILTELGMTTGDAPIVGAAILAGALLIEHEIGVRLSRR